MDKSHYHTCMWITAYGKIVHNPPNPQGLLIVDEKDNIPLLYVSEVSDDDTINLFLTSNSLSTGIIHVPEMGDGENDRQLLMSRISAPQKDKDYVKGITKCTP